MAANAASTTMQAAGLNGDPGEAFFPLLYRQMFVGCGVRAPRLAWPMPRFGLALQET